MAFSPTPSLTDCLTLIIGGVKAIERASDVDVLDRIIKLSSYVDDRRQALDQFARTHADSTVRVKVDQAIAEYDCVLEKLRATQDRMKKGGLMRKIKMVARNRNDAEKRVLELGEIVQAVEQALHTDTMLSLSRAADHIVAHHQLPEYREELESTRSALDKSEAALATITTILNRLVLVLSINSVLLFC